MMHPATRRPQSLLVMAAILAGDALPGLVSRGGWGRASGRNVPVAPRPKEHVGRNAPCPCGSGKKFKACHLGRGDAAP